MRALGKVKRGTKGGDPQPFQFARKKWGSRPGGLGARGAVGLEEDAHFRKALGKVTWGHRWPEGHALE